MASAQWMIIERWTNWSDKSFRANLAILFWAFNSESTFDFFLALFLKAYFLIYFAFISAEELLPLR